MKTNMAEVTDSTVPEQKAQEPLEGLNNPEVRNLNNEEVQPVPETCPKKDIKDEIAAAFSKSFSNFLKDWIGSVDYQGYCWIPEEDFGHLCEALLGVSTVSSFSMQDELMFSEIEEWGPSDIVHVRVFSTLTEHKGYRDIEVSGTLSVHLLVLRDHSAAYMIGGITSLDPIVVKFQIPPSELKEYSTEVVPLFRIPTQYGNGFMRFTIGGEINERKEVSRYQAERDLVAALRRPRREEKKDFICDLCGQKPDPDAGLTETYRAYGVLKGNEPVRRLKLVMVDDKFLALCSNCSQAVCKGKAA